jgi:hypothetical protein
LILILFFLRRRRNNSDDFNGNFDPARLRHHGRAGGTFPQVNLDDYQLLQEDDGMGGRLAGSTVGGGIVTPFTYTPQQQEMATSYPAAAPLLGAGYWAYGQQQQSTNEDPHPTQRLPSWPNLRLRKLVIRRITLRTTHRTRAVPWSVRRAYKHESFQRRDRWCGCRWRGVL